MVQRINTHKINTERLAEVAQLITNECHISQEQPEICIGKFLDSSGNLCTVHFVVRPVENRRFILLNPDFDCIQPY